MTTLRKSGIVFFTFLSATFSFSQETDSSIYITFGTGYHPGTKNISYSSFDYVKPKSSLLKDEYESFSKESSDNGGLSFEAGRGIPFERRAKSQYFNSGSLFLTLGFQHDYTSLKLENFYQSEYDTISSPTTMYLHSYTTNEQVEINQITDFLTIASTYRINIFPSVFGINVYTGCGFKTGLSLMNKTTVKQNIDEYETLNQSNFQTSANETKEDIHHGFRLLAGVYPVIGLSITQFIFIEYAPVFRGAFLSDLPDQLTVSSCINFGFRCKMAAP